MNYETGLVLLFAFSVITSLVTEAVKKICDKTDTNYASNILAAISAIVVSIVGMICYYFMKDIPFSPKNIIYLIAIVFFSWIIAMVGWDKFMQAIAQIKKYIVGAKAAESIADTTTTATNTTDGTK